MVPRVVVIGLGNTLLGDEGAGVHALRELRREPADGIEFHDGGTKGLSLLPFMEEATHLLVLDAVLADSPPGSIVQLGGDELLSACCPVKCSAHDIALPDLLALLKLMGGDHLVRVGLVGMVPASIEVSAELSPRVSRALPEMVRRARETLAKWLEDGPVKKPETSGRRACV